MADVVNTGKRNKVVPDGMVHISEVRANFGRVATDNLISSGRLKKLGHGLYDRKAYEEIKAEYEERKSIRAVWIKPGTYV